MRKIAIQGGTTSRTARVEELRRLCESGGYRPDPLRTAEAMISYAQRALIARRLDGPGHA